MTTIVASKPIAGAKWINASIVLGSAVFVLALAVSAFFEPQWRVLHFLQALIYVAVVVLTRRRSAWGFGAGVFIAVFWNVLVLFRSPLGHEAISGNALRPDVLIQLLAACGHMLIIVACLVGFWQIRPAARQWGQFVAGGLLAIGYLLLMAFTLGPPEAAQHIKQAFGL